MGQKLKKIRPYVYIMGIFVSVFLSFQVYKNFKFNFNLAVEESLKKYVDINIRFKEISFPEIGTIKLKDVVLKDRKGKKMVVSKELILKYDHRRFSEITEIKAVNAMVYLDMYGDYDINFVDAFKKRGSSSSSSSILKKVIIENSSLYYSDTMNSIPIYKYVRHINGFVEFKNDGSTEIEARGETGREKYFFGMEYLNSKKYEINLDMKNIRIGNPVMQYGYYNDDIDYIDGEADINLKLGSDKKLFGKASVRNGILKYVELNKRVEKIGGEVNFNGREILVSAIGQVEQQKINFNVNYNLDNGITKIGINTKNADYKTLEVYKPLKNAGLDIKGNIENLALRLDIDNKKNVKISGNIDSKDIKYSNKEIKDIHCEIEYGNNIIRLKNSSFAFDEFKFNSLDVTGKIKNGAITGNFRVDNFISQLPINRFEGNYSYSLKNNIIGFNINGQDKIKAEGSYDITNEKLSLKAESPEPFEYKYGVYKGVFNGNIIIEYDLLKDYLAINGVFNQGNNFTYNNVNYGFIGTIEIALRPSRKELISGKGDIEATGIEKIDSVKLTFFINGQDIDIDSLIVKKGKSYAYLNGKYNLKDSSFKLYIVNGEAVLSDFTTIKNDGTFAVEGVVEGKNTENFTAEIDLKSEGITVSNLALSQLYTKLDVNMENGKLKINGLGELGRITAYRESLYDTSFNFRVRDDIVYIDNFYNNSLTLKGDYNIINQSLNMKYSIKNYSIDRLQISKDLNIKGYVKEINGEIGGTVDNIEIISNIVNAELSYGNFPNIVISGDLRYFNDILECDNLRLNNNILTGKYDVKTQDIDAKLNIFESEADKYTGFSESKFRMVGEFNLWGNLRDLKGTGNITLDMLYFKDKKLPSLYAKFNFNKLDINNIKNTGTLSLTQFEAFSDNKNTLVTGNGYYNNETKEIELKVENKRINLSEIDYFKNQNQKVEGNVDINFLLKGLINDFSYKCKMNTGKLNLFGVEVDKINSEISGNNKEMKISKFDVSYGGNSFFTTGNIQFNPMKYSIRILGEKVDMKVLNLLLKDKVKNISGIGDVDLTITENNAKGILSLDNFGMQTLDDSITIAKTSALVELSEGKLKIYQILGKINDGDFKIDGEVGLTKKSINDDEIAKIQIDKWNINGEWSNFRYSYGKGITIYLSGKTKIADKKITGAIVVDRGEIRSIPISIEKKDKENKSFEIPKDWQAHVDFTIKNQLKVDIEKVLLIDGIEANIEGGGFVTLDNGKINVIGTISTDKGAVGVNNKIFKIESGVVVFDDPYQYYPNINPSIAVRAQTDVASEAIYVDITGYLNKPQISLSSSNNLAQSDIISLLTFNNTMENSTPTGVVKDILENRINQEIFNPISEKLSKTLGVSKVKISSNILEDDSEEFKVTKDIRLGAAIEIGDKLYKDNLYWNLNTKLSDKTAGQIESYNFSVDYKIKEAAAISAGVGKIRESDSEGAKEKMNFHFGLEFRKKFDWNFGGKK